MDLPEMRSLVRRDLKDEDSANYRWTDDEIHRAIQRAVAELDKHRPQEMQTELPTVDGERDVDISSLTDHISVDKVEFPIDEHPREFTRFSVYQDTLTLEHEKVEGDGEDCRIFWSKHHLLDDTTSTIPTHLESLIALGATAYAAISASQYHSDRANIGGNQVDRDYAFWGRDRLKELKTELKRISRQGSLRTGSLYTE